MVNPCRAIRERAKLLASSLCSRVGQDTHILTVKERKNRICDVAKSSLPRYGPVELFE